MSDTINISTYSDNVRNNSGEFSKLKSELGLRYAAAPSVSSYILQTKLKKAIKNYDGGGSLKAHIKKDRLITKLDKFGVNELNFIVHILESNGIDSAVEKIQQSAKITKRQTREHFKLIKEDE